MSQTIQNTASPVKQAAAAAALMLMTGYGLALTVPKMVKQGKETLHGFCCYMDAVNKHGFKP